MAVNQFTLNEGQRAERKLLITVAEWKDANGAITIGTGTDAYKVDREILGTRTEDSSIEFNADIETTTDIRGNNYTDLNKTQPQQSFDPYLILGGSKLGAKLHDIMLRNAVSELNQFTMYIIMAYIEIHDTQDPTVVVGYAAQKQTDCTITYDSLGGDVNVNFPITVYFSNKTSNGKVDKLADDFVFDGDVNL